MAFRFSLIGVFIFLSFLFFLSCEMKSKELTAILNSSPAKMSLLTGIEVERTYVDKRKSLGKPMAAKLRIIYCPISNYSKENVFNEIIENMLKDGWEVDIKRYGNEGEKGYFVAHLDHGPTSVIAKVLYTNDLTTVSLTIENRTLREKPPQ